MKHTFLASVATLAILVSASAAFADDAPAICADRPTKSSNPCAVDAGHFQLETDIFNVTTQHQDGVTNITTLFTNPTIKYGIGYNSDLELNLAPVEQVYTKDANGSSTLTGVGDLYLRDKTVLINDPTFQLAIYPYVKAPTARHGIGNGAWETGLVVPITYNVTKDIGVTINPEVDVLKDNVGSGYHLNTAQVVSVNFPLPAKLTGYVDLWADYNFDPIHTVKQYTADFSVSYLIAKDLEVDGGINIGLNKETPQTQIYVGFGKHF